ncbi:MAG: acyl carrier protein [Dehalococcoidia bacterium]|nr:acyl carrier protein [Dehalococcoidia bacterium]
MTVELDVLRDNVIAAIAGVKGIDGHGIDEATQLFSLDGSAPSLEFDSFDALELSLRLEEQFNVMLGDDADFAQFATVASVIDCVTALLSTRDICMSRD